MQSEYQHPARWRFLYRQAIFERDSCAAAKRVSDAEEAIAERMRELLRTTGVDVQAEREAMDDALYALKALRVALEENTRVA